MDQRDKLNWVVVELSSLGEEKVEDGTLENQLRRDLKVDSKFPIFIPSAKIQKAQQNNPLIIHLMEGYVFLGAGLADVAYYALEHRPYVNSILSSPTGMYNLRSLQTVSDMEVQKLKDQLHHLISEEVDPGVNVNIISGKYKGLNAEVIESIDDQHVSAIIKMRSWTRIVQLPRACLEVERG